MQLPLATAFIQSVHVPVRPQLLGSIKPVLVAVLVAAPSWAVLGRPAPQVKPDCLARIHHLLRSPTWRTAQVGICFARAKGEPPLFEYDAHKLMMPASNTKLFTSSAAIALLGPDFRFRTELKMNGEVDSSGVLRGNLYIVGSGDPSLQRAQLKEFIDAVQAKGIRRIEGNICGDGSLITDGPYGFGWEIDDLPYYYEPEVSALSLDRNQVTVIIQPPQSESEPVRIEIEPATDYVRVTSRIRVTTSGSPSLEFERDGVNRAFEIRGAIPVGGAIVRQAVSIPTPALYAAHSLRVRLAQQGIEVSGISVERAPRDTQTIGAVQSALLAGLVRHMNKISDNLYAELLLRTVGLKMKGKATAFAGIEALRAWMSEQKIPTDEIRLMDGSGLSRHNLVSSRTIVRLLQTMWNGKQRAAFVESLPIAGEDGTLRTRMRYSAGHRAVLAKTGTLGGVSTLSGYVTVSREPYVFSIMVNHYIGPAAGARKLQEDILMNLMEGVRFW